MKWTSGSESVRGYTFSYSSLGFLTSAVYGEGVATTDQSYKYNGKELDQMHGLNWYDYEARMYAGYRFTMPAPLGDQYPDLSPYAYCANNPVRFIDPAGMLLDDYVLDKKMVY